MSNNPFPTPTPGAFEHAAVLNPDGSMSVLEASYAPPPHPYPPYGGAPNPYSAPASTPSSGPTYSYGATTSGGMSAGYGPGYASGGGSFMTATPHYSVVVSCPRCRQHLMPPPGAPVFACTCGQRMQLPAPQPPPRTYEVPAPAPMTTIRLPYGGPGSTVSVFSMPTDPYASPPGSGGSGYASVASSSGSVPFSGATQRLPAPPPMATSKGGSATAGVGGFSPPVSITPAPARGTTTGSTDAGRPAAAAAAPPRHVACPRCTTLLASEYCVRVLQTVAHHSSSCHGYVAHTALFLLPLCSASWQHGFVWCVRPSRCIRGIKYTDGDVKSVPQAMKWAILLRCTEWQLLYSVRFSK